MENNENKRYSNTSWIVFLFSISIVLISLIPVIFPALFSEIFFKSELDSYGISTPYNMEPFELGALAIPLLVTNILFFPIFFFLKNKDFQRKIKLLTEFKISRNIAIIVICIMISVYIVVSITELDIGDEIYGDWERLKHKLLNMDSIFPNEVMAFEPHLKITLLKISQIIFDNFFVMPLLSSIGLLIVTYLFTREITNSRLAGLVALSIVLPSNLFLTFDTSAAFASFWILFYLLSLYFVIKVWPLSPIFHVFSILSKLVTIAYTPMSIFFILNSEISKRKKIITLLGFILMIIISLILFGAHEKNLIDWNSDEFWLGFTVLAFQMRLDGIIVLFLLPLTVLLFIVSKNNRYANSILVLITGTLLISPLISGFTDFTNQPYRLLSFVVFFSVGVGLLFTNRNVR